MSDGGSDADRRTHADDVRPARAAPPRALGSAHTPLEYQSGFGNEFATEALRRRAARRTEFAAARALRPVRRAALGHRVHRAARREPALVAVSHPARRRCTSRFSARATAASSAASTRVPTPPNQLRWDPLPMPDAPTDFVDGLVTMAGNGDPAAMSGCGDSPLCRQPLDDAIASSTMPTASC